MKNMKWLILLLVLLVGCSETITDDSYSEELQSNEVEQAIPEMKIFDGPTFTTDEVKEFSNTVFRKNVAFKENNTPKVRKFSNITSYTHHTSLSATIIEVADMYDKKDFLNAVNIISEERLQLINNTPTESKKRNFSSDIYLLEEYSATPVAKSAVWSTNKGDIRFEDPTISTLTYIQCGKDHIVGIYNFRDNHVETFWNNFETEEEYTEQLVRWTNRELSSMIKETKVFVELCS